MRVRYYFFALLLLGSPFSFAQQSIPHPDLKHPAVISGIEEGCYYMKQPTHGKHYHFVRVCLKPKTFRQRMDTFLSSLTPAETSVVQEKMRAQRKIQHTPFAISFFEPTYILPFYYTESPYQSIYRGNTPDNQRITQEEFKAQMSFLFTLWPHMFHTPVDLDVSYTQLSYWQFYAKSQFFRETDYEPAIFLSDNFSQNWLGYLGLVHQSNGRGGNLERSWNRVFLNIMASGDRWLVSVEPWVVVFQKESTDLHNPDITDYLGYGRVVVAVTAWHQEWSLMVRNAIESGFRRGALEVGYSIPIGSKIRFYVQFFTGYGQSLIEYNHYTNSFGFGVSLNDWI